MAASETLRSIIDAGRTGKRLDELTTARIAGKASELLHAAQQKAGPGKAIGPVTPNAIEVSAIGAITIALESGGETLAYSAPEIVGGGAGDRRSDVYSLGVVMWEALTHVRLYETTDVGTMRTLLAQEVKTPSEHNANIPAELSAICMRALARNPADRYQSVKTMGVEIDEFLDSAGYVDSEDKLRAFVAGMVAARPRGTLPPPSILKHFPVADVAPAAVVTPTIITAESGPATTTQPLGSFQAELTQPMEILPEVPATPPAVPAPAPAPVAPAPAPAVEPVTTKHTTAPWPLGPSQAPAPSASEAHAVSSAIAHALPPIDQVGAFAPQVTASDSAVAVSESAIVPSAQSSSAATVPLSASSFTSTQPLTPIPVTPPPTPLPRPEASAAPLPINHVGSAPVANPVDVVSLPRRAHRDSESVLASWAWQTDSGEPPADAHYEEPEFHHSSRKPLLIVIGCGLALATVATIIAVGFGGSSSKPPAAAAKQSDDDQVAAAPPGSATLTAPAATAPATTPTPTPDPGSAVASGSSNVDPGSASAASAAAPVGSAAAPVGSAAAPTVASGAPDQTNANGAVGSAGSAGSASAPAPENGSASNSNASAGTGSNVAAVANPPAANNGSAAPPPPTPTPAPPPPPAPSPPPKKAPDVVKAPPKPTPPKPAAPKTVARADKPKAASVDVEAAYRTGLQQFARGDTTGALSSLRTALAANPNYAPTWRGLGLVFEKLGEKDQARAAYKRYLQLAPSASDGEQIRGRMERLGS